MSAQSVLCIYNSEKLQKLARGKFAVGQGKKSENIGNSIMHF